MNFSVLRGLIAVSVLAPGLGAAQPHGSDPQAADDQLPRLEETVDVEAELPALPPSSGAATRYPVAVKDLPLTLSVIPASLLRDQDAFVLGDALKNASGVNVGTGFGTFDTFVVRGIDALTGGLILTDGAPEPESTFYPLYNVRQVEVLKGPSGFLYGGSPTAGAVQMVRKQPRAARFGELSLTYGKFGTYAGTLDGNLTTSDGKLAFRLNGTIQGTDSHRQLSEGKIHAVHPTLLLRPDDATRLLFGFEFVRSEWPPDTGVPFVGERGASLASVSRSRSYQSPFDESRQDVYRARFDAERKLSERLTLRNRFYFTGLDWNARGTLINGTFDLPFPTGPRAFVLRALTFLDDSQKLVGDQLELVAAFETASVRHELLTGVELTRYTDRFVQDVGLLAPIDLLDPVEPPGGTPPATIPAFGLTGDARSLVFAPYVVDRLSFGKRWQAFLGARLDVVRYEDAPSGTERDATNLSPLLSLSFAPSKDASVYVAGSTSFAPPSTQVIGPREPEKGRQVELGGKLQFLRGKGFLGASLYALERDNIAIPDSTGFLKQSGHQRSRGFELDFTAQPAQGLTTYASYAFTDSELTEFADVVQTATGIFVFDRSGNTAPFSPRHLLNIWVSKEFANGFGVAGGLRSLSDQFVGEDNRYTIDAYTLLDAALSYRRGRTRFALNLKNVTGAEYATRGFGGVSAIPGRPFELLGRVDVLLGAR
jgi:TonB-dependent siderophore receptor